MGSVSSKGPARAGLDGFLGLWKRLVTQPRTALMLVLFLGLSWLAVQVYAGLVVTGVPVAVFDLDQSRLSRMIRTSISAPREVAIDETAATIDDAWERLADGRLGGLVVIPRGLAEDLKRGRESAVLVAVDGGNILVGKNVYKALAKAVGQVSAGVQVTTLRKQGARKDRSVALAVPIATDERPLRNPSLNYGVYVAPGLLFFLLHLLVLLLALTVFLPENRSGSAAADAGALLACFLLCTGLGMAFAYAWLRPLDIVPASGPGWMLAWVACLVACDLLMAVAFVAVLPTPLVAVEATILLGMLSMMLSGITWPLDHFPPLLRGVASMLPFSPFAKGLQAMIHDPAGLDVLGQHLRVFARQAAFYGAVIAVAGAVRRVAGSIRSRRLAAGRAP